MFSIISFWTVIFSLTLKILGVTKRKQRERISQNDGFGGCVWGDKSWSWGDVDGINIET